jgi:hypothetical protein
MRHRGLSRIADRCARAGAAMRGPGRTVLRFALAWVIASAAGCFALPNWVTHPVPGRVAHAGPDAAFVSSPERILVINETEGLVSLGLDGRARSVLIAGECWYTAGTPSLYLIRCGHGPDPGALYALDQGGRRVRRLFEHVAWAHLAPDGRALAAVTADGAHVVIMDLETLAERSLIDAPDSRRYIAVDYEDTDLVRIQWKGIIGRPDIENHSLDVRVSDGAVVKRRRWPTRWDSFGGQSSLGRRRVPTYVGSLRDYSWITTFAGPSLGGCTSGGERCACGADWQLDIEEQTRLVWSRPGARPRTVARVEGRQQGSKELGPTPQIADVFVSSDCRAFGFHYDDKVYVVDVASGRIGLLATGAALLAPAPTDRVER